MAKVLHQSILYCLLLSSLHWLASNQPNTASGCRIVAVCVHVMLRYTIQTTIWFSREASWVFVELPSSCFTMISWVISKRWHAISDVAARQGDTHMQPVCQRPGQLIYIYIYFLFIYLFFSPQMDPLSSVCHNPVLWTMKYLGKTYFTSKNQLVSSTMTSQLIIYVCL